jgi:hypothetical protein
VMLIGVQWDSNHGNATVNCFLNTHTTTMGNEDTDIRVT